MMNVVYCADRNVFSGLELSIYTLLTHNKGVNIFIFTMDIILSDENNVYEYHKLNDWEQNKIKKVVSYLDPNSNVCFIDVAEYYKKYLADSVNEFSGFTPYATLRLIVDKVLDDIDIILYLDCDTAIQSNIEDMYYQYSLPNNKYYCYASYASDACEGKGEMVSGIMLMNLTKMKELNIFDTARALYKKNHYIYPDQMALRDSAEIGWLPETYGYMEDLDLCPYEPAILHFTNQLSPKIYQSRQDNINPRDYFYKKYPRFKYVKDSCEMLDKIPFKV